MRHSSRRAVLAGLLFTPAVMAMPTSVAVAQSPPVRRVGAAVRPEWLETDRKLADIVRQDCTLITPEIHMKWDHLQYQRYTFWHDPVDRLAAFARAHGMKLRGHALLWHQSTPPWAKDVLRHAPGDWRPVREHFTEVVPRFRDIVEEWDVVNEPIDTEGGVNGLRNTCFHEAFGPNYIHNALVEARMHAPNGKLAINEFSLDYDNPVEAARRTRLLRLAEQLKSEGVPLDAIGIQAHLDLSKGPIRREVLAPFLADIAGLGLSIAITELDVKETSTSGSTAQRDQRVADHVRSYLDIVLEQPAVTSVTTWGVGDRHSWLQPASVTERTRSDQLNRGLPYDGDLRVKPDYRTAVQSTLTNRELGTVTTGNPPRGRERVRNRRRNRS